MIYNTVANLTTNNGNTISIAMSYETDSGDIIDLNDCVVTYSLFDMKSEEYVLSDIPINNSTLIIESEESKKLNDRYLIKVKIDNNGYIDNYNIALLVKF